MASIEPTPAGTFRVCWRENGRPKSKIRKTRPEAKVYLEEVERRLTEGKLVMRRSDVPTLSEFTAQVLATWSGRVTERTLGVYAEGLEVHVLPFLGHLPLTDLRPRRLGEWQEQRLAEGAGPAVLGKTQRTLGRILRKAVLPHEYLDHNPVDALDQPGYTKKSQRWLTAEEVEALRTWYLENDDPGSATLISILAYIGIRPQGALARTWADLTPGAPGWVKHASADAGGLTVTTKNVDGKIVEGSKASSDSKYVVYVPGPVLADLEIWRPISPLSAIGLLWPQHRDGKPWTKTDWGNWSSRSPSKHHRQRPKCFKRAAEDIGLGSTLTPYHLRHTAATLYAAAGWSHIEVAKQLMHSPAVSASTYQHLFDQRPTGAPNASIDDYIREARGLPRTAPNRGFIAERS